jgi:hypothetical protein
MEILSTDIYVELPWTIQPLEITQFKQIIEISSIYMTTKKNKKHRSTLAGL